MDYIVKYNPVPACVILKIKLNYQQANSNFWKNVKKDIYIGFFFWTLVNIQLMCHSVLCDNFAILSWYYSRPPPTPPPP